MNVDAVDLAVSEIRKAKETPADPTHLTDRGNAMRLHQAHGEDLRWVALWRQWLVWDGKRWKESDEIAVRTRACRVLADLFRWATEQMEKVKELGLDEEQTLAALKKLQTFQKHAVKSEDAKRLNAMVDLLRSEPGVRITHDCLVPCLSESEGLTEKVLDINPSPVWVYTTGVQHLLNGSTRPAVRLAAALDIPIPDTVSPV